MLLNVLTEIIAKGVERKGACRNTWEFKSMRYGYSLDGKNEGKGGIMSDTWVSGGLCIRVVSSSERRDEKKGEGEA